MGKWTMNKHADAPSPKLDRDRGWGLYNKYAVTRIDGSSDLGGKHYRCKYFVLDLKHDPYSKPALLAYARACAKNYPLLARDLRTMVAGRLGLPVPVTDR